MNSDEALAVLELPPSPTPDEIRARVRELYRLWSNRVATAPTVAGRQEAERQVELVDQARKALDFPASQTSAPPRPASVPAAPPAYRPPPPPPPARPTPLERPHYAPPPASQSSHYRDWNGTIRCTAHQLEQCQS